VPRAVDEHEGIAHAGDPRMVQSACTGNAERPDPKPTTSSPV
jgi:hypothetical protein